jgi:rhodanese-related sulfurtransferase
MTSPPFKTIVIIGGVASGASCATRLRRMDVLLVAKGPLIKQKSKNRPLAVYCAVGGRAHNAARLLRQHGFDAANLSGGYTTFLHVNGTREG